MTDAHIAEMERQLLDALLGGGSRFGRPVPLLEEALETEPSPGRAAIEATLRGLRARNLVRSEWSHSVLTLNRGDGESVAQEHDGEWWIITDAGRAAIGLPPWAEVREEGWMNPSSGPWRVSPLIAPYCAWRFRHGKPHLPGWYARLTGKEALSPDE
jgi:hypothetical protein